MPGANTIEFTPVPFGADVSAMFGNSFALPVVGNFDPPLDGGSGPAEPPAQDLIGVASGNEITLDVNGNGVLEAGVDRQHTFGQPGDVILSGDWDGDGIDEVGAFRPSNRIFYLDLNGNGTWDRQAGGDRVQRLGGLATDIPVIGDWNGDGIDEIGLHRNRNFLVDYNGNGRWDRIAGGDMVYAFGAIGDTPIVGDWNGDGKDDVGVYRELNQKFYLDSNGSGWWDSGDTAYRFSSAVERPIIGDWNGDGKDDIGAYAGGSFYLDFNANGRWDDEAGGDLAYDFGTLGDAPLIGRWAGAVDGVFAGGGN